MRQFKKLNNKKFYLPAVLLLLLIVSGIVSPLLVKNRKTGWEKILEQKIQNSENVIKNIFNEKITDLIEYKDVLKSAIKTKIKNENLPKFNNILAPIENVKYSVQLFDDDFNLVYWKGEEITNKPDSSLVRNYLGQAIFHTNKLVTFISVIDTITNKNKTFYLLTALPIEYQFQSENNENKQSNLTEYVSKLLSTSVKIFFDPNEQITHDGRIHSFILVNNFRNKIGVVDFEKPAPDNEIYQLEETLNSVQSVILIMLVISIGWIVHSKINKVRKLPRFMFYFTFTVILRFLLFITGVPSIFLSNELTDASNFSSTFAFGTVRSPLEFTITAILGFIIILIGFRYFLNFYDSRKKGIKNWRLFLVLLLPVFFLILLTLRGLGASLRSVVFDSSIRYFKEFNLIPNTSTFLMDFNILLVGFSVFLFCLILLMFIYSFTPEISNRKKNVLFVGMFIILQISGFMFDVLQKQPQGTPLIRILFITVLFILGYLLIFYNYRSLVKFLFIAFGASVATVSLLTYYNSEIERESLKTTAQDLTRSNESIYRFMVFQTLSSIKTDPSIKKAFLQKGNMSPTAFVQWTKSLLYHETLPARIAFYDPGLNKIGAFSNSKFDKSNTSLPDFNNNQDSPDIVITPSVYGRKINIHGSEAIYNGNSIIGYASVSVIYDESYFNFVNLPGFITAEKSGISSALNMERLKIFYFHSGVLENSYGSVQLSETDVKSITGHKFSIHNEAWLNFNIAGEKYLFYLLNIEGNEPRILAVAKEEKNFTWSLSDFFKVFFVHTIIILTAFLFVAIWNIRKLKLFMSSFKTKLAAAFVVVSVIPLVLIAVYFKNITEGKNSELVFNRLGETAGQVENYINTYLNITSVEPELIFEKAAADLNSNFSIYKNKRISFSSNIDYYNSGLIDEIIPMKAWNQLYFLGINRSFIMTKINGENYYSVFLKSEINKNNYVIEVNSRFNNINLPLSDIDVSIFMFGVFSLAIILLIIFSTILAEQISSPIRKLTNATRSLGSGDLNVEVAGNYKGEFAELTNGFNMMVKRLRKSQMEMAQLERETAWKEMAKQVAHEIKNPLTPMKLSVQQLMTAYSDKSPKFDAIFEKVTSMVISQIETLKNIASEFSNFARMPKLNIERINLIESVRETVNLFLNENLNIKFSCGTDDIFINADHDHLNRTLINLVRNSIQASAKNIFININIENNVCLVRMSDNGTGIEKESVEKIFDDNYTTKSGGMGLGLSMAKKFLESINGNISVEKTSTEGTVFLITIPLAE